MSDSTSATKSPQSAKVIFKRLSTYLSPYKKQFTLAILCMVVFGASDGVIPFLIKNILDGIFAEHNKSLLYILPIALILFALLRAISDFLQQYLMAKTGHQIVRDVRDHVSSHIINLSSDFYAYRSTADLTSRITSDVMLVRTLLTDALAAVIRDSIRLVALLISAIYMDWVLALISFLGFPIALYPVYKFARKMRKLSRVGQDAIGQLSAVMNESAVGHRVVKVFSQEKAEQARFAKVNQVVTTTFIKADRIKALTGPLNEVLAMFAISGVILYGGLTVLSGIRSQGEFIGFLVALFLMYDPFKKLSRLSSVLQQGLAGAERIFEILDTKSSILEPATAAALPSAHSIELLDVNFSYPKNLDTQNNKPALSNINLKIEQGKSCAIVGLSGSGKSTLVDLLIRMIDPTSGQVLLGGVDIKSFSLKDLRASFAIVSQHTFLFNDSVYNNIAFGRKDATAADIEAAAKAAFAYDFIQVLPQKFDTILGESGLTLSGGERQRLAIARAILKDAPILVLDEATASLDNQSEQEVQKALDALSQGRTTIVIAHRLSTIRNADQVVVLKDGQIVEHGQHDQLLDQNGEFARLYNLQFARGS
jgi:subfamily B ATP-binding cassette protein MsbA